MNKTLSAILIVVVVILGAGGAYVLFIKDDAVDQSTQSNTGTVEDAANSSATNNSTSSETTTEPAQESSDQAQTASVAIKNFAFSPASITVKKGTTVTWTNEDSAEHNAFSDQDGGPKGRLLKKGESYSFTFDKVGTFNYICTPHPYMKGTVTVTD